MIIPLFDDWRIRPFSMDDAQSLAKYANNYNVWKNLRDLFPHPYSVNDAKSWIRKARAENPASSFAIASSTEAIGGIGIHVQPDVYRKSAELGYWLGEPFWGKGIATAAVAAIVAYGFTTLDIVRIFAGVFETNAASARVLERAGFTLEGRMRKSVFKAGNYLDQLSYSLLKEDWLARRHS